MIQLDEELVHAIGRRRSVIVVGSGVSRNSTTTKGERPPTWESFLRVASENANNPEPVDQLIDQKDFLTACEVLRRNITHDKFISLIRKEFQSKGYRAAKIHEHIYNLDSSIVLSPNFDNIYETYAQTISNGTLVVKDHTHTDIVSYLDGGETRLLIKTHDSASTPTSVIFTRRDYAEARTKHVLFYEIVKSLVLTHRFLFLGCGTDDPDIRALFEDVQYAHNGMPCHFMTIPKGEVHSDILAVVAESMKVRFLEYAPDNAHEELTTSLGELVTQVETYREQIAADQKW